MDDFLLAAILSTFHTGTMCSLLQVMMDLLPVRVYIFVCIK